MPHTRGPGVGVLDGIPFLAPALVARDPHREVGEAELLAYAAGVHSQELAELVPIRGVGPGMGVAIAPAPRMRQPRSTSRGVWM